MCWSVYSLVKYDEVKAQMIFSQWSFESLPSVSLCDVFASDYQKRIDLLRAVGKLNGFVLRSPLLNVICRNRNTNHKTVSFRTGCSDDWKIWTHVCSWQCWREGCEWRSALLHHLQTHRSPSGTPQAVCQL